MTRRRVEDAEATPIDIRELRDAARKDLDIVALSREECREGIAKAQSLTPTTTSGQGTTVETQDQKKGLLATC